MSKSFEQLTDADDGTGGIGAWIPSEHFVDMILEGIYQKGQLAGKVTALNYDMAAGNGNTVNVRYVSVRDNIQEKDACMNNTCLSAGSTTFGDHTIEIKMVGDYDVVCDFAMWQAKGDGYAQIAKSMSDSMAAWRDLQIWNDLCGATANTTVDTASAWVSESSRTTDSCCNYAFDIYNAIIEARQHLFGDGYNPDTVIIHPFASAYLYFKENGNVPAVRSIMPLVKYGEDGYVASIAGMKVIEAKAAVAEDSTPTSSNDNLAFVIDSSRALGEAWGKRPTFTKDYVPECNNYKMVLWTYWGHDQLDENAIISIENP